jgi:hypothetical protein
MNIQIGLKLIEFLESALWPILIFGIYYFSKARFNEILISFADFLNRCKSLSIGISGKVNIDAAAQNDIVNDDSQAATKTALKLLETTEAKREQERDALATESINDGFKKTAESLNNLLDIIEKEKLFNILYGSQIVFLMFIRNNLQINDQKGNEHFIYIKSIFPDFYSKWTYSNYVHFLYHEKLIQNREGIITLTEKGLDFLNFMTGRGYHSALKSF